MRMRAEPSSSADVAAGGHSEAALLPEAPEPEGDDHEDVHECHRADELERFNRPPGAEHNRADNKGGGNSQDAREEE